MAALGQHLIVDLSTSQTATRNPTGAEQDASDAAEAAILEAEAIETARTQRYAEDVAALTALVPKLAAGSVDVLTPDDVRLIGRGVAWLLAREAL